MHLSDNPARHVEVDIEQTMGEIDVINTGAGGVLRVGAGPAWLSVFVQLVPFSLNRLRRGSLNG